MARVICEVKIKDKKTNDLMLMMGSNETIDQLAIANSVSWVGNV